MASIISKIKAGIGWGKQPPRSAGGVPAKPPPPHPPSSSGAEATIRRDPEQPITTSTMTREALKARRLARVEHATNLVEHLHIRVMLRFLDGLCLVAPFWIIAFTTSEVGQLFTKKAFDLTNQTSWNAYAPALIGEAVFAGLTFLWQYAGAYRTSLEVHSEESARLGRWILGVAATWGVFAAISALGQFMYLRSIWQPADVFGYALIVGRVTLYIGSEWACAKYLGWRVMTLRRIAQEEKAKGEIYAELERQEADRLLREAEADMHLRQIDLQIQTQERNAKIANDVQEVMSVAAVRFLNQFTGTIDAVMNTVVENVNQRLQVPPVEGEVKRLDEPPDDL